MGHGQTPAAGPPEDPFGAFCRDNHIALAGALDGPLAGLSFAAKDVFDIRGAITGFGHPAWLASHGPADDTAEAAARLLDAGAALAGKTVTDELCYSLSGENIHYGTPRNPRAPDRIPGGSSSGSAVAVAAGLVDFALGTDCGGSVRVPASYCGIPGMRPTHGRVPLKGVHPFGPSFDCAGWFARDADVLLRVGEVLLDDTRPGQPFRRLIIAEDAFERANTHVREALAGAVESLAGHVGVRERARLSEGALETWFEAFRILQAAEVWRSFGDWITRNRPQLGPGVRERFEAAAAIAPDEVRHAAQERDAAVSRLKALIGPGDVVCFPTTPRPAPLCGTETNEVEITYRHRAMALLCPAGLAGLPQISLPLGTTPDGPVGLSVMGRRDSDIDLLALAVRVCGAHAVAGGIRRPAAG